MCCNSLRRDFCPSGQKGLRKDCDESVGLRVKFQMNSKWQRRRIIRWKHIKVFSICVQCSSLNGSAIWCAHTNGNILYTNNEWRKCVCLCEHEGKQIPSGATATTRERDGEWESQIKNENCVLVTHFHDVFPSFPPDVPVNDILNTFRLFQEISLSGGEKMFLVSINFKLASSSEEGKNLEIFSEKVWLLSLETALDLTASRWIFRWMLSNCWATNRSRENWKLPEQLMIRAIAVCKHSSRPFGVYSERAEFQRSACAGCLAFMRMNSCNLLNISTFEIVSKLCVKEPKQQRL